MCLTVSALVEKELRERFAKCNEIVCYKVLSKDYNGQPVAVYRGSLVELDNQGYYHSNYKAPSFWRRILQRFSTKKAEISVGIHVFLYRADAEQNFRVWNYPDRYIIEPVICHKNDLLGAGYFAWVYQSAVFTKVKFDLQFADPVYRKQREINQTLTEILSELDKLG